MPYLIDGHNLIPKIPGLSLQTVDDEQVLLELLQEFCRRQRKQVEVFFDKAPLGSANTRRYGAFVHARFVHQDSTADEAIRKRLAQLGREARNWTVVSSDLTVQAEARAAQARILSSETFAGLLEQVRREKWLERGKSADAGLSPDELDEWLDLFDGRPKS